MSDDDAKKGHVLLKQESDSHLLDQAKVQRVIREIESLQTQAAKLKPAASRMPRRTSSSVVNGTPMSWKGSTSVVAWRASNYATPLTGT